MRRIVLAFVRVGRSVGLMLEALSLEARTRGKDRRRKLSAFLSLSLSHSVFLLSSPLRPLAGSPSSSLLSLSTFLTTRHCVPPRWNPVYSLTLWIFRKRFAASRARLLYRLSSPASANATAAPFFLDCCSRFELSQRFQRNRAENVIERLESRASKGAACVSG